MPATPPPRAPRPRSPGAARPPVRPLRALLLAAVVAASLGCLDAAGPDAAALRPHPGRAVLFIGNSLTYTNTLPLIVEALVDSGGAPAIEAAWVTAPDTDLQDHWLGGQALRTIASRRWDVVVLQQGPSSRPESRELLLDYVRRFAERIRAAGGTPALYQVWPAAVNAADFDRALESYRLAAAEVDGLLFPAGAAWRAAWRRDPTLELYADGLHPNVAGSYLAALTMYVQLTGRTPVGLPARLRLRTGAELALPAPLALLLQEAAAEAAAAAGPAARRSR